MAGCNKDQTRSQIPLFISYILIALADPIKKYVPGSNTFGGTGLNFYSEFNVLKATITLVKKTKPNLKFILSIGGATYAWKSHNYSEIISLMKNLGLDRI